MSFFFQKKYFFRIVVLFLVLTAQVCNAQSQLDSLLSLGYKKFDDVEIREAWHIFDKISQSDPKYYKAYHAKAKIYLYECLYEDALEEVNKAIQIYINDYEGFNLRGRIYLSLKETYKAKEDFKRALSINSKFADALYGLGLTEYLYRNISLMRVYFRKASIMDPSNIGYLVDLASIQYYQGLYKQSIKSLNDALTKNPEEKMLLARIYVTRAASSIGLEDFAGAARDCSKALKLSPNNTTIISNIGVMYFLQSQYKVSIVYMDKALEMDRDNRMAYFNRGRAYYEMNELVKALEDFRKACSLNYKEGCYWVNFLKTQKSKQLEKLRTKD